jgi:hypothetical protein
MLSCRFLFDMMTGNCDMENEKGLSITELFRVESSQVNSSCVWCRKKKSPTKWLTNYKEVWMSLNMKKRKKEWRKKKWNEIISFTLGQVELIVRVEEERKRKRNVRPWHDTTRKQQFNWPLNWRRLLYMSCSYSLLSLQ